ncbi:MAG: hypothetical protein Q4E57_10370 [Eubacteriales bacterium]|nr:hypothetical protein [Eubacteriales bacterium]
MKPELGIRSLYGSTGLESIKILDEMITILLEKYKDGEEWVTTRRMEKQCFDMAGNQVEDPIYAFEHHIDVEMREIEVERYEGHNPNYWKPTAANAVKPLYQLKSLAQMRPDCIWEGD